jgi:hypothetical protein
MVPGQVAILRGAVAAFTSRDAWETKIMSKSFTMGGTATFDFVEPIGGYVVAMSGDFDGGVFARVVGEPRVDGAQTHVDMEHFFLRKDGSAIRTRDKGVLTAVEGQSRLLAETTYTVAHATGAFEGMEGQFRSWGAIEPETGKGVLRFWGVIEEAAERANDKA